MEKFTDVRGESDAGDKASSSRKVEDEERKNAKDEASSFVNQSQHDGRAYVDAEDNLKFFPPLYRQRYEKVRDILKEKLQGTSSKMVVEFGCAELAMFSYLKQIPEITKLFMVDIDESILEYYSCRAAPLTCDYLCPRQNPFHVEVMCGSVADCDARMLGADIVICIELIEHLESDIVDGLEKTIFGFIEPEIAIFTTPNSDFNVLLKGMKGKFRHYDHKFEWSRSEFQEWTRKVTSLYPHYQVDIDGVGVPPVGHEDVGHCSQLAMFTRCKEYSPIEHSDAEELYKICRIYDHPVQIPDARSDEEKLSDEVKFQLDKLGRYERYQENEDHACIPFEDLIDAVKTCVPSANIESIRGIFQPTEIVEKDGKLFVTYRLQLSRSGSSVNDMEDMNDWNDQDINEYNQQEASAPEEDERWDTNSPPMFGEQSSLVEYHMNLATFDNAMNLMYERHTHMDEHLSDWMYVEDSSDDDDDDVDECNSDLVSLSLSQECERLWNSDVPPQQSHGKKEGENSSVIGSSLQNSGAHKVPSAVFLGNDISNNCLGLENSHLNEKESLIFDEKPEPITDSGVDLSPLLNQSFPFEMKDLCSSTHNSSAVVATPLKAKELPKSTSVEVLHLDGSCTLKRPAGLEYIEFAPSTSVALCYTGQTYCRSDKLQTGDMFLISERKSLDGSLVRDVADSCSLDFAGDSGYPNSSSLHHDIDVDLTPEQVDDISSENGERSNQSFSEDELSDSSDRVPPLPRRAIHPRRPGIPIIVENVENGDLANNNRDGEGNNAVAPHGDEREFVALVQEGDMQPLLAAPVVDDVILPNDADPFPDWLMDLLNIDEGVTAPLAKVAVELDCDEGLGEDT